MPFIKFYPTEREASLIAEVFFRYRIHITTFEARILTFFIDLRLIRYEEVQDRLWPEEDGWDCDFNRRLHQHIFHLRRKLKDKIEIEQFHGVGYAMTRLGPKDNPMHERK